MSTIQFMDDSRRIMDLPGRSGPFGPQVRLGLILSLWFSVVTWLAAAGAGPTLGMHGLMAVMLLSTMALVSGCRRMPAVRGTVARLGPARLGPARLGPARLWRLPAALAFWYYGTSGLLPTDFALWRVGIELAGGTAALLAILSPRSRPLLWLGHGVGLASILLVPALVLSFEARIPDGLHLATVFPFALIPAFFLPLAPACHGIALGLLWRGRGRAPSAAGSAQPHDPEAAARLPHGRSASLT